MPDRKPPPDTVGNLHGRILAARLLAQQTAAVDAKGGSDPDRALAKRLAEIEPTLKALRRRLAAVRKKEPVEASVGDDFLDSLKSV
jgi:hypothetical protein